MSTNPDSVPGPISIPPTPPPPESAYSSCDGWKGVGYWARVLLARNPFYILSALLLLWSMRRLSLDSRVFSHELPQLLFNFSSFQVYELLLAFTAIMLARRRVWYDSGLLVGLDNLFICVPFLLVSQALLLENWVAFALCLTGCALVLLRVCALKRRLLNLNMPAPLCWAGLFLLCFNFVWPVVIRMLHKDLSLPAWDDRGLILNSAEWNWIIPAAVGLAALLPIRSFATALSSGEEAPFYSWRSFPLLVLLMWIAGTCVHLYCISYVYGLPWNAALLTPAIWMVSWMLWRHVDNLAPVSLRIKMERVLLFAPALVALGSAGTERRTMCLTIAVMSVVAYGVIASLRRDRLARHLCMVSGLLACLYVPHPALAGVNAGFAPTLFGAALAYIVGWAVVSKRPKLGILAGICLSIGVAHFLPRTTLALNFAIQAGLIFVLLHSLRWDAGSPDAATARKLCALYWLLDTMVWIAVEPGRATYGAMACGVFVLVVYAFARLLLGKWGPAIIAYSAVAVVCSGPLYLAGQRLLRAPDGVLTLLGSFALFGLGTWAALMKARVGKREPETAVASK
jgi:hypothetical protein